MDTNSQANETTMETSEENQSRERRTFYFLGSVIGEFKSKSELEAYLNKNGGIPSGLTLLRGSRVEAETKQVFKIN